MRVEATAPCRADLAGGTLDIWPLGVLHPGALTVNVAIPVRARVQVDEEAPDGEVWHAVADGEWRRLGPDDAGHDLTATVCFFLRPAGRLRVRVLEQAPVGSGLGGSSAYAVALAQAVDLVSATRRGQAPMVALLRDLEARVLGVPTGTQDHWAAMRGGCLALHLEAGGERVERLAVSRSWLERRLTVFFTGITHHSGMVNWQVIRRRLDGDPATTKALESIAASAREGRLALAVGDEAGVAGAVRAEWQARRRLAPEVAPEELCSLELALTDAGALAVKACGAGGGGSVLIWHPEGARETMVEVARRQTPQGFELPPGIARKGCRVRALETSG